MDDRTVIVLISLTVGLFLAVFVLLLCLLRRTVRILSMTEDVPDNLILVYTSKLNLLENGEGEEDAAMLEHTRLDDLCYDEEDVGKAV